MTSPEFDTWWARFRDTGHISPLRLGASREEVQAALGPPDDVGGASRKHPSPAIWKYGAVELHFEQGTEGGLHLIYLEDADGSVQISIARG